MSKCEICGEPMPDGEEMLKYHGLSGPCPKPPKKVDRTDERVRAAYDAFRNGLDDSVFLSEWENAPSWVRDLMKVAYLQGALDAP